MHLRWHSLQWQEVPLTVADLRVSSCRVTNSQLSALAYHTARSRPRPLNHDLTCPFFFHPPPWVSCAGPHRFTGLSAGRVGLPPHTVRGAVQASAREVLQLPQPPPVEEQNTRRRRQGKVFFIAVLACMFVS